MKKIFKEIIKNPLFSGSTIMLIGSNSVNFLNLLYHFLMGKLLGSVNYGELVALISLMGLLGIVAVSMSLVIVKYISVSKNEEEITGLTNWFKDRVLKISFVLFTVIILLVPFITSFLHINNTIYVVLIGVSYLFSLPTLVNRSILQGLLKFREMISSVLAENLAKLVLGTILVYMGFGINGAMVGLILALIIGWYLTSTSLKMPIKRGLFNPDIKSMARFAVPVTVQTLAITSIYSTDILLVKHFFSAHDAGIYSVASTLGKIVLFGTGPIAAVMFPLVSRKQSRGENYKKVFQLSFLATLFFSLVVLIIYWLFPAFVITILYNYTYLEAKSLLFWFGLFMSLFTLSSLLISYNLSLGRTNVVWLPLVANLAQIIMIWFYHPSLFIVIIISMIVMALLMISLFIYSSYGKRFSW